MQRNCHTHTHTQSFCQYYWLHFTIRTSAGARGVQCRNCLSSCACFAHMLQKMPLYFIHSRISFIESNSREPRPDAQSVRSDRRLESSHSFSVFSKTFFASVFCKLWKTMNTLVINRNIEDLCSDGEDVCDFNRICLKIHLKKVRQKVLEHNLNVDRVKRVLKSIKTVECCPKVKMKDRLESNLLDYLSIKSLIRSRFVQSLCSLLLLLIAIYVKQWDRLLSNRCAVANNYFVMEMTRPVTDCRICRNVNQFLILDNPSKEEFAKYGYTGQPILVRGATDHWSALKTFHFDFFRKIYSETPDAYESVEQECQFFPFKTDFHRLSEVFGMPKERVRMTGPDPKPWYIGWSNCNPEIARILRKHYERPNFLPDDSESSAIDWIFMGYSEIGASMHLDYVQRPSWQAQISGSKTWHLLPPPECEAHCQPINITVQTGEIILIDTNQWYHDTHPTPGPISITIGSEYD